MDDPIEIKNKLNDIVANPQNYDSTKYYGAVEDAIVFNFPDYIDNFVNFKLSNLTACNNTSSLFL